MTEGIDVVMRAAGEAANAGRWDEAERLWTEVHRRDPANPRALFSLGVHALQRRDFVQALNYLETACAAAPREVLAWLTLGVARRHLGDLPGEGAAIQAALAIDPYHLPALLAKAAWLERSGAAPSAAMYYRNALKIAPPEPRWPPDLRPQLLHARAVSKAHSEAFAAHLTASVDSLNESLPLATAARWREAISIMAGLSRAYHADGNQLQIPRLPAVPFFDRDQFAWTPAVEAMTDRIRAELLSAIDVDQGGFKPYIAFQPGQPVNQWTDLNHSERWSAYNLWRHGDPVDAHVARCPVTHEALALADMPAIAGFCPNALFSALAPRTHIPPHHGESNARVIAHLPLVVPEGCVFRVGFDERRWRVGEIMVFDDTIEHEARNDSDALRTVLIFDVWNPLLTPPERQLAKAVLGAAKIFDGGDA